jgi:hypothetical protein
MLGNKTFQRCTVNLRWSIQRPNRAICTKQPCIKKEKFWMRCQGALGTSGKHRHPERQQQIFQYGKVAFYGFTIDMTFPRHIGKIQHPGLRKTDCLKKSCEIAHMTYDPFHLYFFPQIKAAVCTQDFFRRLATPDNRQHAKPQGLFQAALSAKFGGHERMQSFLHCPTT